MSKLIPLETLKTFLKSRRFTEEKNGWYVLSLSPTVIDELDSLPTIDPIATIDEMIEYNKKSSDYMNDKLAWPVREKLLQELKSRLSLTQK